MIEQAVRERVLVVDDDDRNRELLRAWLEPRHQVLEAPDGPTALTILDRDRPDLVLLDVMMPGMSGFEVCLEIKRRQADGSSLPVLLLTGLSDQAHRTQGLRAGADDFVTKPCDRTELVLRVQAFLRARRQDLLIRQQVVSLTELAALKDDLISLIVHDLRNPLSALVTLLSIARAEEKDPELRVDLDVSLGAATRARDMAEELLEVRMIEERKVPARRARCSIEEIAREVIRAHEAAVRGNGVAFGLTVRGDAVGTLDEKLVRRAVENLVRNAVRYAPPATPIDVGIHRSGRTLEIEVADRGPGVPERLQSKLFEKFGAVEARSQDARRGFGLGLYMVKLVAESHGGDVTVQDRPGGGAVFRMRVDAEGGGA